MALSRVTTWASGNVLTASALNGEFNNILDNALSLISPLTGTLDVNSNSLTNFNEIHFINAAADATAAGRLRRNGAILSWHNGTVAADVITEHAFTSKGAILTATAANTVVVQAAGTNGRVLRSDSAATNGITYGAQGGYIFGLGMSNSAGDPTNDIDIAIGEAASNNSTYGTRAVMALTSALTKQLDAAWAVGTNAGGLDTGAIANGTYHVWLIMRSDTGVVDALFSTSASAPTMPANYDFKRRIGSILRESAAIVTFSQVGDEFLRSASSLDYNTTNPGTSAVTATLKVPVGIKVRAIVNVAIDSSSNNVLGYVSSLDQSDEQASRSAAPLSMTGNGNVSANQGGVGPMFIRTNTSAQIRLRISVSGVGDILRAATLGWIDRRDKDA